MAKKMDNSGLLSIDFIAGFTIFMIAFIAVATLISGLLVNLQSKTIDYDAVAYRTGVILVEDPGYGVDPVSTNYTTNWELIPLVQKENILRYGLAVSKDYPNILSEYKVSKFFTIPAYSGDYHRKVIFDEPPILGPLTTPLYHYNIQLTSIENQASPKYWFPPVGDEVSNITNTGYIHRVVKIKAPANGDNPPMDMAKDNTNVVVSGIPNGTFIVYFDFPSYYDKQDPIYGIDPLTENTSFTITNIPANTTLQALNTGLYIDSNPKLGNVGGGDTLISQMDQGEILLDGVLPWTNHSSIQNLNSIRVFLNPEFFIQKNIERGRQYYIRFNLEGSGYNTTQDYNFPWISTIPGTGVSSPPLVPADMEVRIW